MVPSDPPENLRTLNLNNGQNKINSCIVLGRVPFSKKKTWRGLVYFLSFICLVAKIRAKMKEGLSWERERERTTDDVILRKTNIISDFEKEQIKKNNCNPTF